MDGTEGGGRELSVDRLESLGRCSGMRLGKDSQATERQRATDLQRLQLINMTQQLEGVL